MCPFVVVFLCLFVLFIYLLFVLFVFGLLLFPTSSFRGRKGHCTGVILACVTGYPILEVVTGGWRRGGGGEG